MAEIPPVKKSEPSPIDMRKVGSFIALMVVPVVLFSWYFITEKNTTKDPITVIADKVELKKDAAGAIEVAKVKLPVEVAQDNQAAKSISTAKVTEVSEQFLALASDSSSSESVAIKPKNQVLTQETNSLLQQVETQQHTGALNHTTALNHAVEKTNVLPAEPELPKGKQRIEPVSEFLTIARTVLTSGIRNREPVDDLGMNIRSDVTQSLYLFSEVRDMAGQTLTHRWLLNGTEMASVNLNVGGIRWRTYSRKTITPAMVGLWRVELLNSKGDLLSVHKFDYARFP